jgi:hypothetical protein
MAATSPGQIAFQPQTGNNTDTNYFRSLSNDQAMRGQQSQNAGGQAIQNSLSALTKVLTGDRGEVESQLGPEVDNITQQFSQIRRMIAGGPRGGGSASTLAQLPFKQSGDITGLINSSRNAARASLGQEGLQEQGQGIQSEQNAVSSELQKMGINQQERATNMKFISDLTGGLTGQAGKNLADILI